MRYRYEQDIRDEIAEWTHGEPWRTWVAHAAIALVLTPLLGGKTATGYYLVRECEQIFYSIVDKKKLTPFDHFMDVAVPAVAVHTVLKIVNQLRPK
jgi:GR25 family glycosyltransferase involved in LPS biosynthesis